MGTLYLVGTPIGNLEDITLRALRILKEADVIACEDTRVTGKLKSFYEIETRLIAYHEHNQEKMNETIIQMLTEGQNVALVSDAGLPLISDPGYELVTLVREAGLRVETVPGPNAALTALMTSGLSSYSFLFEGFLPRKEKEKRDKLSMLMAYPHSIILYESPHRVKSTLETIAGIDPERKVSVARELTKKFEQVETADVTALLTMLEDTIPLKGEFVLVIDGQYTKQADWWQDMDIMAHIQHYLAQDISSKDAIKQVAVDRSIPKREVYNIYHT